MWYIVGYAILLILVWVVAVKLFPHTITIKEGLIVLTVQTIVIGTIVFGSLYGQGSDTQILNGQVLSKQREVVSCEHSYSCNCRQSCSGSGKSRSCSTVCDTCYEHSYDVDWAVRSDVGSVTINRIDRQGLDEPPRWSSVYVGQPFSTESSYYNYIKASPFSIFNKTALDEKVEVPEYIGVHDYYKINRVVNFGSAFTDTKALNDLLNESLKNLGPKYKVNVVVVLHKKGDSFAETLKAKHLGGKINDVYVVIDIDKGGVFNNVAVFSWSKSDMVNIAIRDGLLDIGKFDAVKMNDVIAEAIKANYKHRSIEEFKYLEDEVEVPKWAIWLTMVFGILFPFVGALIAHKYEIA